MKVLVTGSRDWPYRGLVRRAILQSGATIVVHGDAPGADTIAKEIAQSLGIEQRPYPANWKRHGRAAGPIRNQQMLDVEHVWDDPIARVLAFPLAQSKGTLDMIERAERLGIPVTKIAP